MHALTLCMRSCARTSIPLGAILFFSQWGRRPCPPSFACQPSEVFAEEEIRVRSSVATSGNVGGCYDAGRSRACGVELGVAVACRGCVLCVPTRRLRTGGDEQLCLHG